MWAPCVKKSIRQPKGQVCRGSKSLDGKNHRQMLRIPNLRDRKMSALGNFQEDETGMGILQGTEDMV